MVFCFSQGGTEEVEGRRPVLGVLVVQVVIAHSENCVTVRLIGVADVFVAQVVITNSEYFVTVRLIREADRCSSCYNPQ